MKTPTPADVATLEPEIAERIVSCHDGTNMAAKHCPVCLDLPLCNALDIAEELREKAGEAK